MGRHWRVRTASRLAVGSLVAVAGCGSVSTLDAAPVGAVDAAPDAPEAVDRAPEPPDAAVDQEALTGETWTLVCKTRREEAPLRPPGQTGSV